MIEEEKNDHWQKNFGHETRVPLFSCQFESRVLRPKKTTTRRERGLTHTNLFRGDLLSDQNQMRCTNIWGYLLFGSIVGCDYYHIAPGNRQGGEQVSVVMLSE